MRNNSQGSFPRLAIVGSDEQKTSKTKEHPAAPRAETAPQIPVGCASEREWGAENTRVKVMPNQSRPWPLSLFAVLWQGLRNGAGLFREPPRQAAVLSFRRHGFGAPAHIGQEPVADESVAGKKASGRVPWQGEHAAGSKEEGRG